MFSRAALSFFLPPPPPQPSVVGISVWKVHWVPSAVSNAQIHTDFKYKILTILDPPWGSPDAWKTFISFLRGLFLPGACSGPSLEYKISLTVASAACRLFPMVPKSDSQLIGSQEV